MSSAAIVEPGTPGAVKYTATPVIQDDNAAWIICSGWRIVGRLWGDTLTGQGRFISREHRAAMDEIAAYLHRTGTTEYTELSISVAVEELIAA